jgi:hypothetical protein
VLQAGASDAPAGDAVPGDEKYTVEWEPLPLYVTRMALVAGVFAAVMLTMLWAPNVVGHNINPANRSMLWASMTASGALAAAGGALWLLDQSRAPLPTRVVDDLTIPAAALLAGAAFIGGRGRALLACFLLPPALLAAMLWRQEVWVCEFHGYSLHLLLLIGLTISAQRAFAQWLRPPHATLAGLAAILTAGALIALAASAAMDNPRQDRWCHAAALAAWAAGMALLLISRRRQSGSPRLTAGAGSDNL